MARTYGAGEQKSGNTCIIEGCSRRKSRSGMGTCGGRKCIEAANRILLKGAGAVDGTDPAAGGKVKIRGTWKNVKYSKTVRGTHCVVLEDNTTVRLSDTEDQNWK